MNLANKLTITRLCLVPILVLFMYINSFWMRSFALTIFIVAALTDAFDGVIARKQNTVTTLGIFLDPLADKLLVSAAFISFVGLKELQIPAWMVIFIISREYIITGLRTIAASRNVIISAQKSGKLKTTSQIITIIVIMLILIVNSAIWKYKGLLPIDFLVMDGYNYVLGWILVKLPYWLMVFTTALTLFSGLSYLYKHRSILKEK